VQERQIIADRDGGALLIRDAGAPVDTHWIDGRDDLPRLIRAGRHIARTRRYIRNFGVEIEPDELVAAVELQASRGDGWVKIVGDWIDRDAGDLTPSWPADDAAAAIDRAHQLGVRVTAHCFGEQSVAELVAAGIDCIEHGTGLTDDVISAMVDHGTALVPTRVQIDNFPMYADAGEARFPGYAAHIRELHSRADATLRSAYEAGVAIYAGTDAGGVLPHGLIGREVIALHSQVGLSPDAALGAASWLARDWLDRPGLGVGESADLVVYDQDPRTDLRMLLAPRAIILRGAVVS
jgi:imidazolonepropionase-like amidohydrolase